MRLAFAVATVSIKGVVNADSANVFSMWSKTRKNDAFFLAGQKRA